MNRSEQHMPEPIRSPRRSNARRSTAFTLIELIVVMGVIGILALFTALGARRLSAGSRLAAATNAVTSALGTIRAAAIRDGVATGLVFRPVWDSSNPSKLQATELIAVRASGDVFTFGSINNQPSLALRWVPVRSVPSVRLAPGMKVAGPNYDPPPNSQFPLTNEGSYSTQPEFRALVNSCSES
ncbi:MAG: pilus assembly FimT family protein, partial [Phycisphaerales bacterium]